ncbi:D-aminoacid aminotransferase-like PLP-dependent enzyme [Wolfiporia cocos MD-104 SS10]|uniref:D-aminoacid aminotransferase-like PLP-dependent enzyme n=1 Tax=Wolfiporia cocos (strain MD-104) TaxID=742152 RepID=A0A2H3JV61_WOLCO|nr:D-aminoacid aminotransferase-like PLP-dependent enzyme [Wolfiporia cocos MD-104 SS10]
MNAFAVFEQPDGVIELATPPLDGLILPGITRDSVLALAREHQYGKSSIPDLPEQSRFIVSERQIPMEEVKKAALAGTLVEFFGTGTAAVISPVSRIGYLGEDVHIPTGPDGMGPVTRPLWKRLVDIQTGVLPHPWSVAVTE